MKRVFFIIFFLSMITVLSAETTIFFDRLFRPDSLNKPGEILLNGAWQYRVSLKDSWHPIQAPHVLRSQGVYTFRRYFDLDSIHCSHAYRLVFESLEGSSAVYLNKKLLGSRLRTSTPVVFDIAKQDLFFNEHNELVVDLDTRVNYKTTLPHSVRSRGLPAVVGGLTRPIKLLYVRPWGIKSMTVDPGVGVLNIRLAMAKSAADSLAFSDQKKIQCRITVFAPKDSLPMYTAQQPVAAFTASAADIQTSVTLPAPVIWLPRSPALYRIEATILRADSVVDRAELQFGFNESLKTVRWRAIEWVEDYRLKVLSESELRRSIDQEMQAIFKSGANAVRVLGGAPPEYLLSVCDRLGLAVFIEAPLINIPSRHLNADLIKSGQSILKELLPLGQHHPCIAGWGLGNGYDAYDVTALSFLTEMRHWIAETDSRPVYAGFRGERLLPENLPVDLAIWETRPERIGDLTLPRNKSYYPIIYRLTIPMPAIQASETNLEQYQAFQMKKAVALALNSEKLQGVLIAPLRDYWSDTPHLMWGDRSNTNLFTAGLLDSHGQPRSAYRVITSLFSGTTLPEVLPGELFPPEPYIFQALGIVLLLLVLFFIKQDKRMSHYVRRAFFYPHGFYTDLVENRQLAPFLTGLVGMASFLAIAAGLTSLIYYYRCNTYIDEWLTWLFPGAKIKYYAIWFIWRPTALIALLTLFLEMLAIAQAILIKLSVLWHRRYLRFTQILSFVHWVPANFLFAIPVVIVLYRSLEKNYLVQPLLFILLVLVGWFLIRMLRGLKVILQTGAVKALLYLAMLLGVTALALILYFEPSRSLLAYISYYSSLLTR